MSGTGPVFANDFDVSKLTENGHDLRLGSEAEGGGKRSGQQVQEGEEVKGHVVAYDSDRNAHCYGLRQGGRTRLCCLNGKGR